MITIESKTGRASVRPGEMGRVEVTAMFGEKAATFHVRAGDNVAECVAALKGWLHFSIVVERKLITAIHAVRGDMGMGR